MHFGFPVFAAGVQTNTDPVQILHWQMKDMTDLNGLQSSRLQTIHQLELMLQTAGNQDLVNRVSRQLSALRKEFMDGETYVREAVIQFARMKSYLEGKFSIQVIDQLTPLEREVVELAGQEDQHQFHRKLIWLRYRLNSDEQSKSDCIQLLDSELSQIPVRGRRTLH